VTSSLLRLTPTVTGNVVADDPEDLDVLLARAFAAHVHPLPRLTVSEWADAHRVLSRESSAEPGQWQTERAPYLRGIMDAFSEPEIEEVVLMSASQAGKTEVLNNVVGYHIDQDPAPILVLQPNVVPMAEAWSKDRLAPMLRDTPRLHGKVRDPKAKDSGNTILRKTFPGGHLTVAGANSAAGLASRPIRVVLCDEVDRYPASAGAEGDPVKLATKRTETFSNRKIGKFSTPTLKGASRIEHDYERGDRRRYFVPCPSCDHYQVLRFRDPDGTFRLVFDRDDEGHVVEESVGYACESCGTVIPETEKQAMLQRGEWRAERIGGKVASFHLSGLYSPWRRWVEIAQEFLDAKDDPEKLQVFINTTLGESWEELLERMDAAGLAARAETYPAEVPAPVGVLTASVDVQGDRLELAVRGWGPGQESWLITHERLYGNPEKAEVWSRLDMLLDKSWRHELGGLLKIRVTLIDSGYLTPAVYSYVRPRQRKAIHASKGQDGTTRPIVGAPGRANAAGVRLFPIGVHTAKDMLFRRLRIPAPGPGYMHFCRPTMTGADGEYFAQFEAEKKVRWRSHGIWTSRYVQQRDRNEAIDLEVGCLAGLYLLGPAIYEHLDRWAARMHQAGAAAQASEAGAPPPPAPIRRSPPRRGGFVGRWKA